MQRRQFLAGLTGAVLVLSLPSAQAAEAVHYDVSYIWTRERSEALDYLTQLKELLGIEVATRLELVQARDGRYGVVYNLRYGSQTDAEELAARHDALLRRALGGDDPLAVALPDQGYDRMYNVSYGLGADIEELKQRYAVVSQVLGAGVTARLFIEQTDRGNYALIYKRYGDLAATRELAARHTALLAPYGLDASFIQERNHDIVFGATTRGAMAQTRRADRDPETGEAPPPERRRERRRSSHREEERWSALKTAINEYIQKERASGNVAADEATSWLVYDIQNDKLLAAINQELPRQCASMVKPFVALAFFHEVQRGRFLYGPKSTAKFTAMIQHSDNDATNWVFAQVGGPEAVQEILTRHYGKIFQNTAVVENIGPGGRTYLNRASAGDYGRFLRAMWREEIPYAAELKRLMNLPGRDRLYYGAPHIPVGTEVYNKTGSTSRLCGDMGILVPRDQKGRRFPYIMVGVIEKEQRASNYSGWIYARSTIIRAVSDLAYVHLREAYHLT